MCELWKNVGISGRTCEIEKFQYFSWKESRKCKMQSEKCKIMNLKQKYLIFSIFNKRKCKYKKCKVQNWKF